MRLIASLLVLVALGCAPIGNTPGMRLGGSTAAAPDSFEFVQETEVIQLEVRGMLFPRVMNVWTVGFNDAMYVWSLLGSRWSQRIDKRPEEVRVRIGENVYEVRASLVKDLNEKKRVAQAYQAKYADPLFEYYGRATTVDDYDLFYRLTPRD